MNAPKVTIDHAKSEIKRLIDAYESLKKSGGIDTFNEDETCRKFILPLFHALGWDTEGKEIIDEVTGQKPAGGQKRVDYSFNISGQPIMFLEAKQLSADLDDPQFARQAINYGYGKTVKWVVLSDFEGIIVFNALLKLKKERISERTVLKLKYTEYLDKIDDLWLLSKESFFSDKLNKHAQSIGHVTNKVPVNELLLSKLLIWRNTLINKITGDNEGLSKEDVAECVQRLLNRLIFIRTCEDRGIDQRNLLKNLAIEWQRGDKRLDKMLQDVFRDFNEGYDSSLFEKHLVDDIKINSELLDDIIRGLYEDIKEDVEFDFAVIDADILGSIYEQYLGTIQKGEGGKDKEKRKSHGIYYTPKYIVDYIVKNTLGKILEEAIRDKDYAKIGKLKVLDPACGSGSFLIKALEMFDDAYGKTPDFTKFPKGRKIKTLCNNIYGVDLDSEAVELTKLNLLLSSTYSRKKLPNLNHNIECGNSLIDDPKVAGDKAFDWNKRFKDVMDKGGFDVIVGNPPYVDSEVMVKTDPKYREYCSRTYLSCKGNWDLFCAFIDRGISLLTSGGYFSMIVPNKLLSAEYADSIRKIIKEYEIISIRDYSSIAVFEASVYPLVIVIKKTAPEKEHEILYETVKIDKAHIESIKTRKARQSSINDLKGSWSQIFNQEVRFNFLNNIINVSTPLGTLAEVSGAATVSEAYVLTDIIKESGKPKDGFKLINTGTIDRYQSLWGIEKTRYIKRAYDKPIVERALLKNRLPNRLADSLVPKIIVAGMCKVLECYFDVKGEYLAGKSTTIIKAGNINMKYLLAVLNSRIMTMIYKQMFSALSLQGGYFRIGPPQIKQLPIILPKSRKVSDSIANYVDRMLKLNKQYAKIKDKQTSETDRLKRQIEEADREIDELVYKVYGLTEEEIRAVEGKQIDKREDRT